MEMYLEVWKLNVLMLSNCITCVCNDHNQEIKDCEHKMYDNTNKMHDSSELKNSKMVIDVIISVRQS